MHTDYAADNSWPYGVAVFSTERRRNDWVGSDESRKIIEENSTLSVAFTDSVVVRTRQTDYEQCRAMAAEQGNELSPYIASMKKSYNTGGGWGNAIWTSVEFAENARETIRNFAAQREDYLIEQMSEAFGYTIDELLKMRP